MQSVRGGGAHFFGHVALLGKLLYSGIGNQPNIAKRHRECLNGQLTRVSDARAKVRFAIEDGEVGGLFSRFRHDRVNDVSSEAESSLAFRQFEVMYFGAYSGEQFVIVYGGDIFFKDCVNIG